MPGPATPLFVRIVQIALGALIALLLGYVALLLRGGRPAGSGPDAVQLEAEIESRQATLQEIRGAILAWGSRNHDDCGEARRLIQQVRDFIAQYAGHADAHPERLQEYRDALDQVEAFVDRWCD